MARSIFWITLFAGALASGGCVPVERPAPAGPAGSADFSGDFARASGAKADESAVSPFLSPFQLKGASDLTDIRPEQIIACRRGEDKAVLTLYFYEEDESGAVCSFLFYSRIHQEGGALETSRRISAEEDANCVSPAQEKLMVKRQIGWACEEGRAEDAGPAEEGGAGAQISLPTVGLPEGPQSGAGLPDAGQSRTHKP